MKITEIEVHQISLPYEDWLAYPLRHYGAPSQRTIYVVHTDTELTGLGDGGKPVTDKVLDRYIGSNPFDLDGGRGQPASGHGDVRSDGQGSRRAGVQALRPETSILGAGEQLDGVHPPGAHGRGWSVSRLWSCQPSRAGSSLPPTPTAHACTAPSNRGNPDTSSCVPAGSGAWCPSATARRLRPATGTTTEPSSSPGCTIASSGRE